MGDMISRDAVLKILNNSRSIQARDGTRGVWINLLDAIGEIERVPAVDAEPVRYGRWIQSKTVHAYYCCSYCKSTHKMTKSCNKYVLLKYCPNCGAKMGEI